ncbi:MAG: hypothetical protein IJZ31_08185 [Bacteroidaceae bacterium]|nr:hypothetical protein [Bacteroidaceae bacterium]
MINYVNNAYDKVLKPCDAQQFNILVKSLETEKLILGHRGGDQRCKPKLPAITYMGALDSEKYKQYLRQCEEQGAKPLGSRRAEFMRPTGLFMLDFDHVEDPRFVYERILQVLDVAGLKPAEILALVHITPSGDGLRVVMERTKGQTIEQDQLRWSELIGIKIDAVCKDISRLSFAPMQKEILYFNPSLLFAPLPDAAEYPDGSLFSGVQTNASTMSGGYPLRTTCSSPLKGDSAESAGSTANESNPKELSPFKGDERNGAGRNGAEGVTEYPTEYEGMPYAEIVKRLEEQLGGRPEHGARNAFIFSMACNLRYICNDDAAWVASILPTYGEDPQKHRATVQSAVNRPMSREVPATLARALRICDAAKEANCQLSIVNCQLPPELPATLPEPIVLLTSCTPGKMRPAVAMAVFPPLGAHLQGTRFSYWDGRLYEPTFMNVLVAELSTGKSAVNAPIDYIIADMEARDEVSRKRLNEWKGSYNRVSSTQEKPERPQGLVMQVLDPDMTNAAFVQALADANGHFLYTQMDEIELLNALKTNTQGNSVSAILRLAFDCGKYGQVRVAANAVNAKVRVRWNWNASSTIQRVRKFFARNIADGTLSRVSFATIIKEKGTYGRNRPTFGQYGETFAKELQPYIDALNTCSGDIHCPEATAWALALCDELADFAEEMEDEVYAQISHRAVLMGFFRAMLLYVMNGMQWSQPIADFAAWTVKYDLWCKMRFFGDMLHADLEGEEEALQRGPKSLLDMLPREFTKQQVVDMRKSMGMSSDAKPMIDNWMRRKKVSRGSERGVYVKSSQQSAVN